MIDKHFKQLGYDNIVLTFIIEKQMHNVRSCLERNNLMISIILKQIGQVSSL